ncbi:DUF3515 family protein [Microbacterium sp. 3J1]|uniref:DUF3515 family protein n=1 Tax=Microbacterium sp. 3J1 TaxID=861269 RepID=UPI000B321B88|nr:DUF3515 family protein [Microbacterium sp. 3J1]
MEPAISANDPACAEVIVRLPASLGEQSRVWTDAQATAAWGTPSAVRLTCGVGAPPPTDQQCVSLGGAEWIVDESESPNLLMTTYGREPAVQVSVDTTTISADSVLESLAGAVQQIPATSGCAVATTGDPTDADAGADAP